MRAEMQQEGEPSVEEILESIKSVIARDNRASAKVERNRRENESIAAEPIAEAPVAVVEMPAPEALIPAAAHMISPEDDILDLSAIMSDLAEEELTPEVAASNSPQSSTEGLITQGSTTAMRESLAALAAMSVPSAPPQIVRSGETSLEGMARELLRPMLAEWLETNLPQIVDDQVKAEIARIAGKKR